MTRIISFIAAFILCVSLAASASIAVAQDSTPEAPDIGRTLPALVQDTEGITVAVALVAESDDEITVSVAAVGLAPGEHGIHIHETGICDPATDPPFSSAGDHYNPTDEEHGDHAGDLGNITAEEDGTALLKETTDEFTLDELIDEDGSAIVIHAEEDENDPEGESYGARIACGVLAEPVVDTASTPVVTEEAVTEDAATPPVATEEVATEEVVTEEVVTEEAATEEVVTEEAATEEAGAVDTDEDGLTDDEEVDVGTDPAVFDSDGDGLGDGDEINVFGTDPLVPDTDGDGVSDGVEVEAETDPLDPASV